jgi:hypothetical protein
MPLFPLRCALPALLLAATALAQPSFVEVTPTANPYFVTPDTDDFWVSALAPADFDGDGDLDLAAIGYYVVYNVSAEDVLLIFVNQGEGPDGRWQFSTQPIPLDGLFAGASDLAWGDFDGDGDHDLAVGSEGATRIFRNDGGQLAPLALALPGYYEDSTYDNAYDLRSLAWADADNDGDLDLLIPSVFDFDLFEYSTHLMRNDGSDGVGGWLFAASAAALDATTHAQSAWADDDQDGDLDLFLVNVDPYTETGFVKRYANDGGVFTGSDLLDIRVEWGLADWGDYDADGDLDLLVAGNILEADQTYDTVLRVYRNDGGAYSATTLIDAPNADWLDLHAATWADYDSDGDVDLLVTGNFVGDAEIEGHSKIWGNDGGAFTDLGVELPAPISSVGGGGSFTWLDLDGDGDLDYLVAGAYYVPGGNGLVETKLVLYRNQAAAINLSPAAPAGLDATTDAAGLTLSWNAAVDDHTASSALTYDLELRPFADDTPAARRLPEPGGVSAATSWTLAGLPPGSYQWHVRAVDSAFNGGARATGVVTIPGGSAIFADNFEAGSTVAWSPATP